MQHWFTSLGLSLILAAPAAASAQDSDPAPEPPSSDEATTPSDEEPPAAEPPAAEPPAEEIPAVDPDWPLLAYRMNVRTGTVILHVDESEGAVESLRFQAEGRRIAIDRVRFEFHDLDQAAEMRPREVVSAGEQSDALPLPEAGAVRRVRVHVRVLPGRGQATLNLLARRAD
ncbi:MAG: hypothetical protein AB8I08_08755 [Sandaracinaceae bacterium]